MPKKLAEILFHFLEKIERRISFYQGKGYGGASIRAEFSAATSLLGAAPKIVVDVGGNVGDYAFEVASRFPNCKIHVIEPSPTNIAILNQRFLQTSNIQIYETAVSDTEEIKTLYSDEEGSGLASLVKRRLLHFGIEMNIETHVKVIKLDSFWRSTLKNDPIDILKIDIEGFELKALEGFQEGLLRCKVVQFEFGGCNIDTKTYFQDFWYFFSSRNFKIFRITPLGIQEINKYSEQDETFRVTNYLALNTEFEF